MSSPASSAAPATGPASRPAGAAGSRRRRPPKPEPVAICRLKRVAADFKDDIRERLPRAGARRTASASRCVGAGPASLTVARDLAPLGYECVVFDGDAASRRHDPLADSALSPAREVIDEETGYVLDLGVEFRGGQRVDSMRALLAEGWDAVFVG